MKWRTVFAWRSSRLAQLTTIDYCLLNMIRAESILLRHCVLTSWKIADAKRYSSFCRECSSSKTQILVDASATNSLLPNKSCLLSLTERLKNKASQIRQLQTRSLINRHCSPQLKRREALLR